MMRRALFALILALATLGAQAQMRGIPGHAKRATLNSIQGSTVTLDGKSFQLSPGAQIRDGHNLIVMPAAVPQNLLVKYHLDNLGQVSRIWILSPAEAAAPDPK